MNQVTQHFKVARQDCSGFLNKIVYGRESSRILSLVDWAWTSGLHEPEGSKMKQTCDIYVFKNEIEHEETRWIRKQLKLKEHIGEHSWNHEGRLPGQRSTAWWSWEEEIELSRYSRLSIAVLLYAWKWSPFQRFPPYSFQSRTWKMSNSWSILIGNHFVFFRLFLIVIIVDHPDLNVIYLVNAIFSLLADMEISFWTAG
jgi:hypothetical protein